MKKISWLTILLVTTVISIIKAYMRGLFDQVGSTGDYFITVLPFVIGYGTSIVTMPLIFAFAIKLIYLIFKANIDKKDFWSLYRYIWFYLSILMLFVTLRGY